MGDQITTEAVAQMVPEQPVLVLVQCDQPGFVVELIVPAVELLDVAQTVDQILRRLGLRCGPTTPRCSSSESSRSRFLV